MVKSLSANAGDTGPIPESGRFPKSTDVEAETESRLLFSPLAPRLLGRMTCLEKPALNEPDVQPMDENPHRALIFPFSHLVSLPIWPL